MCISTGVASGLCQVHLDLQKNVNIYLRKELYTKLIYFDHPNKNVEHPTLGIKKILVQQK